MNAEQYLLTLLKQYILFIYGHLIIKSNTTFNLPNL